MSLTLEQVQAKYPWLEPTQWRQHKNGKGWIHGDKAVVDPDCFMAGIVMHGGVMHGGVMHGGEMHGGVWKTTPLFITGTRHTVSHSEPGHIAIGCHNHPISEWLERYKEIGSSEGYTHTQIKEYKSYIDLVAAADKRVFENTGELNVI